MLQLSCVVGSVAERYSEWNGKETEHKIARKIIAFCYFSSLTPQLSICICSVSLALLRKMFSFFLFWPEINLFAYFDCKCMYDIVYGGTLSIWSLFHSNKFIWFPSCFGIGFNGTFASCSAKQYKKIYMYMDANVNIVARINVRIQFGGEPNNGFSLNTRCQMFVSKYENQYMCTL